MRAMILAAGEGTRLRPITETTPKALVRVASRPLIDYALATVARSGITDVVVNLHYLGHMIREHVGDGSAYGLDVRYSEENPLLGSGGGIVAARELLGESTFVTLNADTIVEADLDELVSHHQKEKAKATMLLRKDPRMEQFGLIHIDGSGRIRRFLHHEGPGADTDLDPFMFTGVQVLEPDVFDYMPAEGAFSITAVTYPEMLAAGEPLHGRAFDGRWITVGTPAELAAANSELSITAPS